MRRLFPLLAFFTLLAPAFGEEALKVGNEAPGFTLKNQYEKKVSLKDFRERQWIVVVLARTSSCPFSMRQLRQLHESHRELSQAGIEPVFVLRDDKKGIDGVKAALRKVKVNFHLLDGSTSEDLAVYRKAGFDSIIVDPEGKIRKILRGARQRRPTAKQIMAEIKKLRE